MTRALLASAFVLLVAGPLVVILAGSLTVGVLIFSAGVVLLGIRTLVEGDRTVGSVLVAIGALTAVADLARLALVTGGA